MVFAHISSDTICLPNYSLLQILRLQSQPSPERPAPRPPHLRPAKAMFYLKAKSCQTPFLLVELMLGYCIHLIYLKIYFVKNEILALLANMRFFVLSASLELVLCFNYWRLKISLTKSYR